MPKRSISSRRSSAIDPYANVQGGSRGTALRVSQLEENKAIAQQDIQLKKASDELQKSYEEEKKLADYNLESLDDDTRREVEDKIVEAGGTVDTKGFLPKGFDVKEGEYRPSVNVGEVPEGVNKEALETTLNVMTDLAMGSNPVTGIPWSVLTLAESAKKVEEDPSAENIGWVIADSFFTVLSAVGLGGVGSAVKSASRTAAISAAKAAARAAKVAARAAAVTKIATIKTAKLAAQTVTNKAKQVYQNVVNQRRGIAQFANEARPPPVTAAPRAGMNYAGDVRKLARVKGSERSGVKMRRYEQRPVTADTVQSVKQPNAIDTTRPTMMSDYNAQRGTNIDSQFFAQRGPPPMKPLALRPKPRIQLAPIDQGAGVMDDVSRARQLLQQNASGKTFSEFNAQRGTKSLRSMDALELAEAPAGRGKRGYGQLSNEISPDDIAVSVPRQQSVLSGVKRGGAIAKRKFQFALDDIGEIMRRTPQGFVQQADEIAEPVSKRVRGMNKLQNDSVTAGADLQDPYALTKKNFDNYQRNKNLFNAMQDVGDSVYNEMNRAGFIKEDEYSDSQANGQVADDVPIPGKVLARAADAAYSPDEGASNLSGFTIMKKTPTLIFYRDQANPNRFLISIRGTADKADVQADMFISLNMLKNSDRFQRDLADLQAFQRQFSPRKYEYLGVGHSLGGAILDQFLKNGMIGAGASFNAAVQPGDIRSNIRNTRMYEDNDPLYGLMGRYTPNPKVLKHKKTFSEYVAMLPGIPGGVVTKAASYAYNKYSSHKLDNFL